MEDDRPPAPEQKLSHQSPYSEEAEQRQADYLDDLLSGRIMGIGDEDSLPENSISIALMRLAHGEGLPQPDYATRGAAGMDIVAAVDAPLTLQPGDRAAVPTGFAMAIPPGFEVQVRPRSGLAIKNGVTVVNAPGTIDSDYRGEVKVLLINLGREPFVIERGMRIAQLVAAPVTPALMIETTSLDSTERGEGGFGSTGV